MSSLPPTPHHIIHNPHLAYRPDVDGLRALAILAVVIFHAFPDTLHGGFVGVDIFFVISGYLITGIILKAQSGTGFSLLEFYSRRIKRIFPALIVVLAFCLIAGWFVLLANEYKMLGKHVAAGAAYVSNLILMNEAGYFDVASELKPLLHLWSLGIEEQFYLFWPLLLILAQRWRLNSLRVIVLTLAVSFLLNVANIGQHPTEVFYLPFSRSWELLLGAMLAEINLYQRQRFDHFTSRILFRNPHQASNDLANVLAWTGVTLILLAIFGLNKNDVFPGWWALFPTSGAVLLIAAGEQAWFNRRILSSKLAIAIGLISYPLYLWHWPLLSFARIMEADVPPASTRFLAICASVLLAWLTYIGLEKPLRTRRFGKGLIVSLYGLMLLLAFVGYNIYQRDGLGFRFNTLISHFVSTDFDLHASWREDVCFLGGDKTAFGACTERQGKQVIFLWGDSHAAALYPGLKALQTRTPFGIAQYTAAGCPPLLTANQNQRCGRINQTVLTHLRQEQPEILLLHADWGSNSLKELPATVNAIRKVSNVKIILMGPVPHWTDTLPKLYWVYWRKYHQSLPERTRFGSAADTQALDVLANSIAQTEHVAYYSAYQRLCNADGCLSSLNAHNQREITSFDNSHLTPSGAGYVLEGAAALLTR